ncbi:hypothetical protein [Insolitispirillum peregrinum]|uniref:hypothetical protein n=1 Tax=Insolitispirillum peregrinum TaxID=80876 RepID=UPI003617C2D8
MADTPPTQDYPGILGEIAAIAGPAAAEAVARAKGGRPAYFPRRPMAGHWLADAVGLDKAQAICDRLVGGGSGFTVPVPVGPSGSRARVWRTISEALAEGCSVPEAAHRAGVDIRTARRHKNGYSGPRRPANSDDQGSFDF